MNKRRSNCNITVDERIAEFPNEFFKRDGKPICISCDKIIDHVIVSTIQNHLAGAKHHNNKLAGAKLKQKSYDETLSSSELKQQTIMDFIEMMVTCNIPLEKVDSMLKKYCKNEGNIPISDTLRSYPSHFISTMNQTTCQIQRRPELKLHTEVPNQRQCATHRKHKYLIFNYYILLKQMNLNQNIILRRKIMIKLMREEIIVELFVNIIKMERKCKIIKQLINDNVLFEPYDMFSILDKSSKGYLEPQDFINFLNDNHHFQPESIKASIDLFIEYYDRKFDGVMNFEEFLNFILIRNPQLLRFYDTKKKINKLSEEEFTKSDLKHLIVKLLLKELSLFSYADTKKLEIMTGDGNNCRNNLNFLLELFLLLDTNHDGFISSEDMEIFFRMKGVVLYQEAISSLISLYDEDLDEMLNWHEYLFMMLPSKKSYQYNFSELRKLEKEYINNLSTFQAKNNLENVMLSHSNKIIMNNKNNQVKKIPSMPINKTRVPMTEQKQECGQNIDKVNEESNLYPLNQLSKDNKLKYFCIQLMKIIEIQMNIEKIRESLVKNETFNLISTFQFFDRFKRKFLNFEDFRNGMNFFGISSIDADLIFQKYSTNDLVKYSKFIEIFIPTSQTHALTLTKRRPRLPEFNLDSMILFQFSKLFNLISHRELFLIELRRNIYVNDIDISYVFHSLDLDGNGFVTLNEFMALFEKHKQEVNEENVMLLIELLDKNKDGKISFAEFLKEFS